MYDNLQKVLAELGETDIEIDSVFIAKVGCICLPSTAEQTQSEINETPENDKKQSTDIYKQFIDALRKHPNVFDITMSNEGTQAILTMPVRRGSLFHGKTFFLSINLPARLQTYYNFFGFSTRTPIEQFEVISSGSLFAAFAPIADYPHSAGIGHEYRELANKQIKKEMRLKPKRFGPNPIHPDFYIAFVRASNRAILSGASIYGLKKNVLLVFDKAETESIRNIMESLFRTIHFPMLRFYRLSLERTGLITSYENISNNFSALSDSTQKILATPWWRVLKSGRLAHSGRQHLTRLHRGIIDFDTKVFQYSNACVQLLTDIKENPVLSHLHSYFIDHTELGCEIPASLPSALSYHEEELEMFGNIRSLIIATLLGGAIGAVLTAFLS
jgi:hypothetical protein